MKRRYDKLPNPNSNPSLLSLIDLYIVFTNDYLIAGDIKVSAEDQE